MVVSSVHLSHEISFSSKDMVNVKELKVSVGPAILNWWATHAQTPRIAESACITRITRSGSG